MRSSNYSLIPDELKAKLDISNLMDISIEDFDISFPATKKYRIPKTHIDIEDKPINDFNQGADTKDQQKFQSQQSINISKEPMNEMSFFESKLRFRPQTAATEFIQDPSLELDDMPANKKMRRDRGLMPDRAEDVTPEIPEMLEIPQKSDDKIIFLEDPPILVNNRKSLWRSPLFKLKEEKFYYCHLSHIFHSRIFMKFLAVNIINYLQSVVP